MRNSVSVLSRVRNLQGHYVRSMALCVTGSIGIFGAAGAWASDAYESLVMSDDPVCYYRLNETGGDVATNRANPGTYDGTYEYETNGIELNWPSALAGRGSADTAAYFDGSNEYCRLVLGNLGAQPVRGAIEFWAKATAFKSRNDTYPNLMQTGGGAGNGFRFEVSGSGGFLVAVMDGSGSPAALYTYGTLVTGQWYHVVLTWDSEADNIQGYLNGARKFDSSCTNFAADFAAVVVGCGFYSYYRPWTGPLDEVAIYDAILSSNAVAQHYDAGIHEKYLAENGQPRMTIATAAAPIATEITAVKELTNYLYQVTGAIFPVISETEVDGQAAIYVGQTDYAANHGVAFGALGQEEWIGRTIGNDIVLAGGRQRGTLYAVYDFLERQLGVHWLDEDTEAVPSTPTVALPIVNVSTSPVFSVRDICTYQFLFRLGGAGHPLLTQELVFLARNKSIGGYYATLCAYLSSAWSSNYGKYERVGSPGDCHTFAAYLNQNMLDPASNPQTNYFATHPEYFAYRTNSGLRLAVGGQLCMVNQAVRTNVLNKLRAYIEYDRNQAQSAGCPYPTVYDISQNDNTAMCQCTGCLAIAVAQGSYSGPLLDFINWIAGRIHAEYPDVLIRTFAYFETRAAPATMTASNNVEIRVCDMTAAGIGEFFRPLTHPYNAAFSNAIVAWSSKASHLSVWDYWVPYEGAWCADFPTPYSSIWCTQPDLAFFRQHNVRELFAEDENPEREGFYALKRWLTFQLMQDPNDDAYQTHTAALIAQFMQGYYGPAAATMWDYLNYMEGRIAGAGEKLVVTPGVLRSYLELDFFTNCNAILNLAESQCGGSGNEKYLLHVRRERVPLDGALLCFWDVFQRNGQSLPFDHSALISSNKANRDAQMLSFRSVYARNTDGFITDWRKGTEETQVEFERYSMEPLPVPTHRAAYGKSAAALYDFTWPLFTFPANSNLVLDLNAAGERALRYTGNGAANHQGALTFGLYDPIIPKFGPTVTIPRDFSSIPQDEQYHWYLVGRFAVAPWTYLWAHASWSIQIPLSRACCSSNLDWDVYVSLKAEGPEYVANSVKSDSVSVDRVLLVKPQGDLPHEGGGVPSAGLTLWLKGDQGLAVNGNTITWADQSPGARNINTQLVHVRGASYCSVEPGAINGREALRFPAASSNYFVLGNGTSYAPGELGMFDTNYEIIVVAQTSTEDYGQVLLTGTTVYSLYKLIINPGWYAACFFPLSADAFKATIDTNQSYVANGPHIFSASVENGRAIVRVDGQDGLTQSMTTNPATGSAGLAIGFDPANGNGAFHGDIGEIMIYDHALSAQDRAAVEAYLNAKYSVTWTNDTPVPALTAPTKNAAFIAPANIVLTATVANTAGNITNVSFYTNGVLLASVTVAPYTCTWTNPPAGRHTVTVKAWDEYGAAGTSAPATVLVWATADIGNVVKPGSAVYSAPTYTLKGAGADIWGTNDAFRFVYLPVAGTAWTQTVKVATMTNPNSWAKCGIMARASTNANAVNALVAATPTTANGVTFQYRSGAGSSSVKQANTTGVTVPRWVRLVRAGNNFSAFQSSNGASWSTVGSAVTLNNIGSTPCIGLALTSHTTSTLCTATVDNVSFVIP